MGEQASEKGKQFLLSRRFEGKCSFFLRLFSTRVAQSMDVYNIHTYMYIYIYVYVHGLFTILKRTVRLSLRFNDLIRNKDKDRGKKLRNCSGRRREAS